MVFAEIMSKKPFVKHGQLDVQKKTGHTQQKPSRHTGSMAGAVESLKYMHDTQQGVTTKNFRVPKKGD